MIIDYPTNLFGSFIEDNKDNVKLSADEFFVLEQLYENIEKLSEPHSPHTGASVFTCGLKSPLYLSENESVTGQSALQILCTITAKALQRYCKWYCSATAKVLQRYCKWYCSVTAKVLQRHCKWHCSTNIQVGDPYRHSNGEK